MPATSEKQQGFMALVHAVQTGKRSKKGVGENVTKAAGSMSEKQSHEFMKKGY